MIRNDNLKDKETIALPLGSSLTTLVVRFMADEAAKKMCYTFRVFVLLIKPIALSIFSFSSSFVVARALLSSATTPNNYWLLRLLLAG